MGRTGTHHRDLAQAIAVGASIGALAAAANVYTGLTTAFVDGGAMTASILAFVLFRALGRATEGLPHAVNVAQATASSAASMVAIVGLAGPVPALVLSGYEMSPWTWIVWGCLVGWLGLWIGWALRGVLLDRAALPFPTGAATAGIIEAITTEASDGVRRAKVLLVAAIVASTMTWLRDGPCALLPVVLALPFSVPSLGIGMSPLLLATGVLVGLRIAASMLVGSLVATLLVVPALLSRGLVASSEFADTSAWLMWPGVAMLVTAVVVNFALDLAATRKAVRDLTTAMLEVRYGWFAVLLALALVGFGWVALGLHPLLALGALALAVLFSALCARAAGETDVAPVGAAGSVTQMALGSAGMQTSLVTGSVSAGMAAGAAQSLWSLRAAQRLQTPVPRMMLGQGVGILVGALVAVPTFYIVTGSYALGTDALPAWGAMGWRATAEAVQSGGSGLPPGAALAAILAASFAVLATVAAHRGWRWIPSPVALGIGLLVPPFYAVTLLLGAAAMAVWTRCRPDTQADAIAAGAIGGESLTAVVIAMLHALA